MSTPVMRFREIEPSPHLCGLVACLWEFVAGPDLPSNHIHSIPLDGSVSVAYSSSKVRPSLAVFVGPRLENLRVPIFPGDVIVGIRFLPGASRAAIGKAGGELFDKWGPLQFQLPEMASNLSHLLLEVKDIEEATPILEGIVDSGESDQEVMRGVYAITASRGSLKVSELPGIVGLSERQFQRRFRTEVGLTPKQYARICRVRATAIDAVHTTQANWGELAAERGFTDQAHLIHEFRTLFGLTPGEFEQQFLPQIEHGNLRTDI